MVLDLASLKFCDPNPTQPVIKKKKIVTQSNPPMPKNRSNLADQVELGRF